MDRHHPLSRIGLWVVLLLLLAVAAPAQQTELIPREVLFGNPERSQPQLSPDGKRLAYLAPDKNNVMNVFVRTVGKEDDRQVTRDEKRGIRFYTWQYDNQHVIYIQDKDGDENWRVYQSNISSGQTRDLTPLEGVQARFVAYDQRFPDVVLVGLNARDRRLHDVHRLDLKTGKLELDTENPGDVSDWTADNNLVVRVAQAFAPDGGTIIRIRDDARSPWREFQRWSADETFGGVAGFTPDNKGVYLLSSVGANAARLLEVDIAGGQSKVLAEDPQYDVSSVMVHPVSNKAEAVQFIRARREWKVLDPAVEADFAALKKVRDGDFAVTNRDLADKTWLVTYINDNAPLYYYAYDRESRKATLLFSNQPKLEQYKLARMEPVSYRARDGLTIHGYLTRPVGREKDLPLVMVVHGGPWARDVWGFNPMAQWLANRGYAVLQVNFRGSTGYGKEFLNAGDREWGARMHDDVIDGKNWAVKQGIARRDEVCIFGGSYGGYATLVGLTFTPREFACGVDIVGPSNLITLLQTIPPYWAPIKALFEKRMGRLEEEEFLKSRSPLFRVQRIERPLLIAQGANDPRVKQSESDQIVEAMRKNDIPVEYYVFPDEGHGFARPENRMAFFAAAEQFLARHLKGRAEPPSAAEQKVLAATRQAEPAKAQPAAALRE